jgi:hypothetical protein
LFRGLDKILLGFFRFFVRFFDARHSFYPYFRGVDIFLLFSVDLFSWCCLNVACAVHGAPLKLGDTT